MKPYKLMIDEEACWGCKTCEVACKQQNNASPGVKLISVEENGAQVNLDKKDFIFHITVCRHCDDPPCVDICPAEGIVKRDDGIAVLLQDQCTGCQLCLDACTYGAIVFDENKGVAQKCNLCYDRLDRGLLPACADNVCLAHCIHIGYVDESVSESTTMLMQSSG